MAKFLQTNYRLTGNRLHTEFNEKQFLHGSYRIRSFLPDQELLTFQESLTFDEKQVLHGSLFGDGSIYIPPKRYVNAVYTENHSLKEKPYLEWKSHFLKRFTPKIHDYSFFLPKTGKTYYMTALRTKSSRILTKYRHIFYPNDKKIIPKKILEDLDKLGLCVWYCDDGCYDYSSENIDLATQGFSIEENKIIQKWFHIKWNLNAVILPNGRNYHMRFLRKDTKLFLDLVSSYIPKCMNRKNGFDEVKRESAKKQKREYMKQYWQTHKRSRNNILKKTKKDTILKNLVIEHDRNY